MRYKPMAAVLAVLLMLLSAQRPAVAESPNPFGSDQVAPLPPPPPANAPPLSEEDEIAPDNNFGFNPPPPSNQTFEALPNPPPPEDNTGYPTPPPTAPSNPLSAAPRSKTPPVSSGSPPATTGASRKADKGKTASGAKEAPKLPDYLELPLGMRGLEVKSLDLPDKDIKDVVQLISTWTGKNFILDNKVRGKITIIGPGQVTLQEAYNAFLSALEANGLTTVQSGKFIRIIESAEARRAPVQTYSGDYAPKTDQFITRIFQLKYINADEVQREFRDLTTRQGKLFAYEPTNSIIITDTGSNIQRIREILEVIDVKSFETTLHVLRIKNTAAKQISDMLGEIYGEDKRSSSGARSFRRSALERTRGGGIISKIIPDEQTNSLIVLANQAGFVQLKTLVGRLDVKVTDTGRIHVYYCEYAKAEDLASTLASLSSGGGGAGRTSSRKTSVSTSNSPTTPGQSTSGLTGGGSGGPVTAELDGGVKVTSDNATNALVITANATDFKTLRRVIKKLDIPRLQVYVETAILEVNVDRTDKVGVNVASGGPGQAFHGGFIGDATSIGSFLTKGVPDGATIPIFAGPSFDSQISIPGVGSTTVTSFSFMGLLNLLTSTTESSVLSTPQIIALDNEKAEFKVQDEIPVVSSQTAATATSGAISNIGTLKTGIEIKLTPHINAASRTVRLEIEQTVDSLRDDSLVPKALSDSNRAKTSRTTNTSVVVRDADYIMMGGLMADQVDERVSKVPLLGDIPILGWLFKSKTFSVKKKNLVILLHPRIIGTSLAAANLVSEKVRMREEFINKNAKDDKFKEPLDDIKANIERQRKRAKENPIFDYRNNEDDDEMERPSDESELMTEPKPARKARKPEIAEDPTEKGLKNLPPPNPPPDATASGATPAADAPLLDPGFPEE